ncbi:exosortase family protein XrtF [Marinigracilibium pacificum]|uniref:Exosortase family protein XrtF n=1 Tax=Marinigracilibium pacificum TaxID=2729599 RepID=A0A848J4D6_9BACT|nr:exosortase family protein XrtF [Marinigracilibium pacificum]NMM48032.1 exosortase family protein XrtF [Marinigracilibium pacificum]
MLKEYKPILLFLAKFLILYFILNLVYGYYVESFGDHPDSMTEFVSKQTASAISFFSNSDNSISSFSPVNGKYVYILKGEQSVLSVYEGCNGINVFIVFLCFVLSFRPSQKEWLWFIPLGLIIIHLFNLIRIGLLFYIAQYFPSKMAFMHKFGFTAIIYIVVFALWWWWVSGKRFQRIESAHE